MGFLGRGLSIGSLKDKLADVQSKAVEAAGALKDSAGSLGASALETSKEWGAKAIEAGTEASEHAAEAAKQIARDTADKVRNLDYEAGKEWGAKAIVAGTEASEHAAEAAKQMAKDTADAVRDFDYEASKERASNLVAVGLVKTTEYIKRTLEVDKTTMEIVQELRSHLPTPAATVDEIFNQCRDEAIRRAIAVFMLGSVLNNTDERSSLKYDKLSDSWDDFRKAKGNSRIIGVDHANYDSMSEAIKVDGMVVPNGYNRDDPLIQQGKGSIAVEHVTSRKELFSSTLLSVGLTSQELGDVMNDKRNLVYAERKTNSQKSDLDLWEWIDKYKDEYQPDDDKIVVTIQKTGEKRVLDKRDLKDAYERSKVAVNEGRLAATVEIASTVAKTGAAMAVQQVVGLIIVETLDIFMDEIKAFKIMTEDGLVSDLKEKTERIRSRLDQRFEERRIWARARELGVEAGVSGALSVLPQILISLFLKMPAFVYAIIRESTLSVVRSVRVLCSNDDNKLDSIKMILFGAASAIAGVYVQRVISTAISGVPLLNKFNSQISTVLSGMIVMAIPLIAIYTFDQNKQKLVLRLKGSTQTLLT